MNKNTADSFIGWFFESNMEMAGNVKKNGENDLK